MSSAKADRKMISVRTATHKTIGDMAWARRLKVLDLVEDMVTVYKEKYPELKNIKSPK